ncbi:deoxycytidyl transferase [Tulasnella sp. 419]|nr:deoxycytidyl transferase [Tulasnella sp. 419]
MSSEDYWANEDPEFLNALVSSVITPPEILSSQKRKRSPSQLDEKVPADPTQPAEHVVDLRDYSKAKKPDYSDETYIYGASAYGGWDDYMRRKRAKLQIQNKQLAVEQGEASSSPKIFKKVAIYVNGFTDPPFQDLREMVMAQGGTFHAYLDRKSMVTHIIATQLTPAKILEYQRGNMKVVKPEWIVESVKAGVLLRWQDYALKASANIFSGSSATQTPDKAAGTSDTPQKTLDSFATQSKPSAMTPSQRRAPQARTESVGTESPSSPKAAKAVNSDKTTIPPETPSKRYSPKTSPLSKLKSGVPSPNRVLPDPNHPETHPDEGIPAYAKYDSNPNAARLMASTQWRRDHTSASADYAESYFQHSRLHHLSAWKAELREVVKEARENAEKKAHSAEIDGHGDIPMDILSPKGAEPNQRVIMHCDFDSFFVAAGLTGRPHLKGKPVVVCHGGGGAGTASTSEIASASYEARKFGIKNGMSLGQAKQLCPSVQTIPYEFEKYKDFSRKFYTVLMSFADDLQAVSVDEALLDVSNRVQTATLLRQDDGDEEQNEAIILAESIRDRIRDITGCEVSIGVSHNIMLARMATRHAKPAGSYHLLPENVPAHLAPLPITSVHGVGHSIRDKIKEKFGATTLGELLDTPKEALKKLLGEKTGEKIWKAVRGVDDTPLESDKPRKSVSADVNYGIRFDSDEQAGAFIFSLSKEVSKRLKSINKSGRWLTLKIMKRHPDAPKEAAKFLGHGRVECFNKSTAIAGPGGKPTDDAQIIGQESWKLLKSFQFDPSELRGIGIQIQKLDDASGSTKAKPVTEPGQSTLSFMKGDAAPEVPPQSSKSKGKEKAVEIEVIDVDADEPIVQPPPQQHSTRLDLPPISQLDTGILESLPEDLRREILAGYQASMSTGEGISNLNTATSSRTASSKMPGQPEPIVELIEDGAPRNEEIEAEQDNSLPPRPSQEQDDGQQVVGDTFGTGRQIPKTFSVSPTKLKGSDVRHITKQLAPKHKIPVKSNAKIALFNVRQPARVDVSIAELMELGIDVDFFNALPIELQREQLAEQRQQTKLKGKKEGDPRASSLPIVDRRLGGAGASRASSIAKSRSPSLAPVAGSTKSGRPPVPKAQYTILPKIKKLSEVPDIQKMVDEWIQYRKDDGPIPAEIQRVANFLIACSQSDIGLEKVVAVMKWWKLSLRKLWAEVEEEDDLATGPGLIWWAAFQQTKKDVDEVVRRRYGCGIKL